MRETHSGGCLCGAIRYTMTGTPTSTNLCYCTQCQRQTRAVMPAFVSCESEQLAVTTGEPASCRSSERATREFCARCGSSLFWRETARCTAALRRISRSDQETEGAASAWSTW